MEESLFLEERMREEEKRFLVEDDINVRSGVKGHCSQRTEDDEAVSHTARPITKLQYVVHLAAGDTIHVRFTSNFNTSFNGVQNIVQ